MISFNVINNIFDFVEPLRFIVSNSLVQEIFPEEMKTARITSIYKGYKENIANYRSISVLPCFSKILERIMYHRLYLYLTENNLLCNKQSGSQTSTAFNSQMKYKMSNKNIYTLGIFIDLPKVFDPVNHKILINK